MIDDMAAVPCEKLTIVLHGQPHLLPHEAGETIVQAAYAANLTPPISCLSGSCATCIARLTEGSVAMLTNDALTPAEVAAGYVLTCQSVPTAPVVTVVYEN